MKEDERRLGFTIDNKLPLHDYVGDTVSCVNYSDSKATMQLTTGRFVPDDVFTLRGQWHFPAGAFKGSDGGPC